MDVRSTLGSLCVSKSSRKMVCSSKVFFADVSSSPGLLSCPRFENFYSFPVLLQLSILSRIQALSSLSSPESVGIDLCGLAVDSRRWCHETRRWTTAAQKNIPRDGLQRRVPPLQLRPRRQRLLRMLQPIPEPSDHRELSVRTTQ